MVGLADQFRYWGQGRPWRRPGSREANVIERSSSSRLGLLLSMVMAVTVGGAAAASAGQ
jgi:hypothetical protein